MFHFYFIITQSDGWGQRFRDFFAFSGILRLWKYDTQKQGKSKKDKKNKNTGDFAIYYLLLTIDYFSAFICVNQWLY